MVQTGKMRERNSISVRLRSRSFFTPSLKTTALADAALRFGSNSPKRCNFLQYIECFVHPDGSVAIDIGVFPDQSVIFIRQNF